MTRAAKLLRDLGFVKPQQCYVTIVENALAEAKRQGIAEAKRLITETFKVIDFAIQEKITK